MLPRYNVPDQVCLDIYNNLAQSVTAHSHIKHLRVLLPGHTHVQSLRPQHIGVGATEPQLFLHKRIVMNIPRAHEHCINLPTFPIFKIRLVLIKVTQTRQHFNLSRQFLLIVLHLKFPIRPYHFFGTVLVALQSHVLGRVASAQNQHSLVFELAELPQLVTVGNFAFEQFYAFQLGDVRVGEVTCGHNHILKIPDSVRFRCQIRESHLKLLFLLQILHVSCHPIEQNELPKVLPLEPCHKVPSENIPWQIRWHWFFKMVLECVVWELETFLGKVGPQLTVHARMDMLTVLVGSATP